MSISTKSCILFPLLFCCACDVGLDEQQQAPVVADSSPKLPTVAAGTGAPKTPEVERDAGAPSQPDSGTATPAAGSGGAKAPPKHDHDAGTASASGSGGGPTTDKPDAGAKQEEGATTFTVALTPAEEFPTCAAAAQWANGTGTATISNDGQSLSVELTHSGLSSAPQVAHIHAGLPGFAGPPVLEITGSLESPIRETFTAADYKPAKGAAQSFADFIEDLKAGKTYFNVHTATCASGEIRGQISADSQTERPRISRLFTALSAEVEVPLCAAASTSANGVAAASVGPERSEVNIEILYEGLSGAAIGAHVHVGLPGNPGPIVLDFGDMLPSPLQKVFRAADYAAVDGAPPDFEAFLSALEAGEAYVNVHTAACPAGEIRGQLVHPALAAKLTAAEELPLCSAASTTAIGSGVVIISQDESEIEIRLNHSGLSSAPSMAHIHAAARGRTGPIVLDLGKVLGSPIAKAFTAADFTPPAEGDVTDFASLVQAIKAGGTYFNVHTSNCMSGEIRGQIE